VQFLHGTAGKIDNPAPDDLPDRPDRLTSFTDGAGLIAVGRLTAACGPLLPTGKKRVPGRGGRRNFGCGGRSGPRA